jgi:hypothetical protein
MARVEDPQSLGKDLLLATDPGAPRPDIDRPDVSPAETPSPNEPYEPGSPQAPDEVPADVPATDVPDEGPLEMPPPMGD